MIDTLYLELRNIFTLSPPHPQLTVSTNKLLMIHFKSGLLGLFLLLLRPMGHTAYLLAWSTTVSKISFLFHIKKNKLFWSYLQQCYVFLLFRDLWCNDLCLTIVGSLLLRKIKASFLVSTNWMNYWQIQEK